MGFCAQDDDERDLATDTYWDYYTQDFSNTTLRMSTSYNQKIDRKSRTIPLMYSLAIEDLFYIFFNRL